MKQVTKYVGVAMVTVWSLTNFAYSASSTSVRCTVPRNIPELFTYLICILDYAVPFLISLALVLFLIGVVRFVAAGDNEEKRQGGRDLMIFGIIALFVMVSVWGFVNILSNTFFGHSAVIQNLPPKATSIFQ